MNLTMEWVGGFFDGEGHFGTQFKKTGGYNGGYTFSPEIRIAQTGNGAVEVFDVISTILDENEIKYSRREEESRKEEWADKHFINISSNQHVKRFSRQVEPYLVRKRIQCKILNNKIFPMMDDEKHLDKEGLIEIAAWKEVLDSYKGGGKRSKYTLEFFEDEWDMKLSEDKIPDGEYQTKYTKKERGGGSIFDY